MKMDASDDSKTEKSLSGKNKKKRRKKGGKN